MPAGRPKKYTAKTLEQAVNRYFKSISCTRNAMDLEGNQICYFSLDQGEVSPDQEEAAG